MLKRKHNITKIVYTKIKTEHDSKWGNTSYKEKFNLKFNDTDVLVIHDFWDWKPFKKQNPQAIQDLKEHIFEELQRGTKSEFLPYCNFGASINWKVI